MPESFGQLTDVPSTFQQRAKKKLWSKLNWYTAQAGRTGPRRCMARGRGDVADGRFGRDGVDMAGRAGPGRDYAGRWVGGRKGRQLVGGSMVGCTARGI